VEEKKVKLTVIFHFSFFQILFDEVLVFFFRSNLPGYLLLNSALLHSLTQWPFMEIFLFSSSFLSLLIYSFRVKSEQWNVHIECPGKRS